MNKLPLLLLVLVAAACSKDPPPVVEPPKPVEPPKKVEPPKPAKPNLSPDLSAAQKAELDASFKKARDLVAQGLKYKAEGEAIEKGQGRAAANDTLVKAKDCFRQACEIVEDWVEPELGKVTEAQVKDHLSQYQSEIAKWQRYISELGKLHK